MRETLPRDKRKDYTLELVKRRQQFLRERTGSDIQHITNFSFDPKRLKGNIENFTGVAQIPIGIAGPLLINGEYAKGEYFVPLATTEGTLVASYNRGMKIIYESGGVKTTVSDDAMQRAPVFIFNNARDARELGVWIKNNFDKIKEAAEKTTKFGKLRGIEQYTASKFLFLRFNYHTGDAAGQNMTGKATYFACEWIKNNSGAKANYMLESNMATDKKSSLINTLHTRGKRVTAEITIPQKLIRDVLGTSPYRIQFGNKVSNIGSFMSGATSNGAHSANGITAMFIACGQDVANVAESSTSILYPEWTKEGDLYYSITIPSLIVATYGGGTALPTQKECLEMMDCYGAGKVNKFAEIVAATVLCGEISLTGAIGRSLGTGSEWVSSHDKMGRNK